MADSNKIVQLSNFEIQKSYEDKYVTERLILQKYPDSCFDSVLFTVYLKESNEEIGEVILIYDGEIWYRIDKDFRRKGYATEAVRKLIEVSKRDDFYLSIKSTNWASKKVAKKLGFVKKKKLWRYQKTKNSL